MKRKIFIGSSTEGYEIAEQIRDEINAELGDWIICETWKGGNVFDVNSGTLDSLIKASRKYDYGVFVATDDDDLTKRNAKVKSMRDNVLFESGLFLGSLGLQRAFLLTHMNIGLPSDFNGTTLLTFNENTIDVVIRNIINEIQKTKNSYNLKPIPSTALALTYYNNFLSRFIDKKLKQKDAKLRILIPVNINDIWGQIEKYKKESKSHKTLNGRPTAYKYFRRSHYWDIPTILGTLNQLIDFALHTKEVGINNEKEEWIKHEIRNFEGTLRVLLQSHTWEEKVSIEYM
jgi:hypothetical protein